MAEKKRILIAEDEKPMARALELKLANSGFDVTVAYDGDAAIAALKSGPFDLMLLDLMMPQKDGFAVLEARQKMGNKTPVIVSSNLSQESDVERAKKLGAIDYFVKSNVPISEVVQHINAAIGGA